MYSFPIIKRWLAWEIGSGNRVVLGRNPFIGCNSNYKLSTPLIQVLNSSNIYTIAQASVPDVSGTFQNWLKSNQIGFSDEHKTKWDNFVSILNSSDILLKNSNDKLVWSWNRSTGAVTANLAYQSILYLNNMEERKWWYKAIWDLNIPIKLTMLYVDVFKGLHPHWSELQKKRRYRPLGLQSLFKE
jgi:hypothetical protein